MDPKIIDGKKLAVVCEDRLKQEIKKLPKTPKVVSVLVGNDPPSLLYTQMKQKKAAELGIDFQYQRYPTNELFENVSMAVIKLNQDPSIDGIMVQLPLPKEFLRGRKADDLVSQIDPKKDVDGLTGQSDFLPAAVEAVLTILREEKIDISGKFAAVLGTSRLVGMPIASELKKLGALVSSVNRDTPNVTQITSRADIIVSATGVAGILKGDTVKDGVVVIDVGTLVIEDELDDSPPKVVGDVDFESVLPKASKITPVPGGVGPLTVISLMENVVKSVKERGK